MHERVRKVIEELAKRRWAQRGPGVMLAKVKFGIILDHWVPMGRISNRIPAFARDLINREEWARLRDNGLAEQVLRKATSERVPVVYCGEISDEPVEPGTTFFWVG